MRVKQLRTKLFSAITSKRFWFIWAGVFASLLGITSGLAQLFSEIKLTFLYAIILIAASIVVCGIYALLTTVPVHLPVDDIVPAFVTAEPKMTLEITTARELQVQANRLAADSYFGVSPIPPERYEQWLMINPTILACLLEDNRQVVGYFDIFPLRPDFFQLFIDGSCSEEDIRKEHILAPALAKDLKRLYLGGIAVANPESQKGRRYASLLCWGLFKYLEHYYCVPCDVELYAEAASNEGEALLKRFGFNHISSAKDRKSKCDLYSVKFTDDVVKKILCSMPDWSHACRLAWV